LETPVRNGTEFRDAREGFQRFGFADLHYTD
jgi:hypothetical protein